MRPRIKVRNENDYDAYDTRLEMMRNVAPGSIIRFHGEWGVLCFPGNQSGKWFTGNPHIVDFWDIGRAHVPASALVEVLKPEVAKAAKEAKRRKRKR